MMEKLILHSKKIIKKSKNSVYFESIPFYELSRYFTYNLVKNMRNFDKEILSIAIKQLSVKQKIDLVNYVKSFHPLSETFGDDSLENEYEIDALLDDVRKKGFKTLFYKIKRRLMENLSHDIKEIFGKVILTPELEELKRIFKLSYNEIKVILFIFLLEENEVFEESLMSSNFKRVLRLMCLGTEISMSEIKSILSRGSRIVKSGIIDTSSNIDISFSLNENLKYFLLGFDNKGLFGNLYKIYEEALFDVNDFNISKLDLEIIASIIKSDTRCNILFYGEPGTGKTELSKSIVNYCGKRAIFPVHNDKENRSNIMLALEAAKGFASNNDVIVVDEADYLLSSGFSNYFEFLGSDFQIQNKAWINEFLDTSDKQIIWIVNHIDHIDKSTARRFVFSLEFKPFTKKEREKAWEIALENNNFKKMLSKKEIERFSEKYPINMGTISFSLNILNSIKKSKTIPHKKFLQYLEKLLASQTCLIVGESRVHKEKIKSFRYDLSVLNTDVNLKRLIKDLKNFIRYKQNHKNSKIPGINLLFYGIPGTGKTEFAKYLSKKLNKEIFIYGASDLMDMYVGGTEKNINMAFKKAESEDGILLIDEADSFFTERRNAIRSWEVSMTNEFLTQLENHSTIFIACTNILESLDNASIRRFHWKIKFYPLTNEGKIRIYKMYFKLDGNRFSEKDRRRLLKIDPITAGDIRAVWQRLMYVGGSNIDHNRIIDEIEREVKIKMMKTPKRIGLI